MESGTHGGQGRQIRGLEGLWSLTGAVETERKLLREEAE